MQSSIKMLGVVTWLAMVTVVHGYGDGPPPGVCEGMVPGHFPRDAVGASPYTLTVSKSTYSPNEQLTVTLRTTGDAFRGFMIQARPSVDEFTTYGSFSPLAGTSNPCSDGKVAVAHATRSNWTSRTFTWTAPGTNVGDIVFVYTVVKIKSQFWPKESLPAVTFLATNGGGQPTQPPTQPPTTQPPTTQPTASGTINRDTACEVTKSCFPSSCSTNCDYLVTWHAVGTQDVEFTLKRKTTANNYYIAAGLSRDARMTDDSVMQCVSKGGSVDAFTSYNPDYYNLVLDNSKFGLSDVTGSLVDGILSCTFRRKINATLASAVANRKKRQAADDTSFFDLNTSWYLLVAHGTPGASTGSVSKHGTIPVISSTKKNFLEVETSIPTTPSNTATGTITKDSKCGDTLGCFSDCEGDSCDMVFTWADEGDDVAMTLTCKRPGNAFCAIGLSKDDKMGDDSVMACVADNGDAAIKLSYNSGRSNSPLDSDMLGLTVTRTTQVDGIVRCEFLRKKTYALAEAQGQGRKKRAAVSPSTYFDLNTDWNLLHAYGSAIGGSIQKHKVLPTVSSAKADFQSFQDISADDSGVSLVKVHGILMVSAWMLLATIGIFMPRFYKPVWAQEGQEWCGQKRWFVLHRMCMVTVFLLTAAAFVIIFVHVEGYAKIDGSGFEKSHPIIGIVVMALTVINPTMAIFRPHPNTPKRPIFNVAHSMVGGLAHLGGIINIFSGTMLSAANLPDYIRIVLWVFVGWSVFIDLCLHIYQCCQKKNGDKEGKSPILGYNTKAGEAYEMKDNENEDNTSSRPVSQGVKQMVLPLHVVVVFGLSLAVVLIIVLRK